MVRKLFPALLVALLMAALLAAGPSPGAAAGRSIAGSVRTVDGGPVEGIVADLFTGAGGQRTGYLTSVRTGADGRFSFNADDGPHIITLIAPDGATFVGGSRFHQVDVPSGDVDSLDATLAGGGASGAVEGRVTTGPSSPVAAVTIDLFQAQGDGSRGRFLGDTATGTDGRFSFDVAAGCYVLTMIAPDGRTFEGGDRWHQPSACVAAGETVADLDARLDPVPDPTPSPDPEPGDPFSGLPFDDGTVVVADHATGRDVLSTWRYVTNGFHEGTGPHDPSRDTQIVHHASGGDLLPAFDGAIHPGYRRLDTAGPQSLWDARNQPDHTRSQVGGWGRSSSIHLSKPGEREFIAFSVRLDPDTQIPGSVLRHTGLYWLSMVSQFKSVLPGTSHTPMIAVYEGRDGIQLVYTDGGERTYVNIDGVPRGVWIRIGIDVLWGTDGAYRWWGDLDGDLQRDWEPLSERVAAATILPGFEAAAFNIGPYHRLEEVPRNGRDYTNIEIVSHPVGDPWG